MRPVADGETRPSAFEVSAARRAGALEGVDVHCYLKCRCSGNTEETLSVVEIGSHTVDYAVGMLAGGRFDYDKGYAGWGQLKPGTSTGLRSGHWRHVQ